MSACISGWCMMEDQAAVIPDIYEDPRIPHDAYRPTFVRSLAMVPVRQEAPIAAMGAYWARTKDTTPVELELLQSIANSASLAIALVELQQQQQQKLVQKTKPSILQARLNIRAFVAALKIRWIKSAALPMEGWWYSSVEPNPQLPVQSGGAVAGPASKQWFSYRLRSNSAAAYAFAVICVGIATLALAAVGSVADDITPFATYYPAVLFAALIGGAGSGMLALVLGVLCSWWAFVPPYYSFHVATTSDVLSLGVFVFSSALIIWIADGYRKGYTALLTEQGKRLLLMGELKHRMRNTLAVVQAIIGQSLRDYPEEAKKLGSRIAAVAEGTNLDVGGTESAHLKNVLLTALQPYRSERIITRGEDIELGNEVARVLALTFHELATNSAKYGSLSVPNGGLSVSWKTEAGRLVVTWIERDGPPVVAPTKRGFGTGFIGRLLDSLSGQMKTDFLPDGLVCEISIRLPISTAKPDMLIDAAEYHPS
jgi:two-component sensor histidine kinase